METRLPLQAASKLVNLGDDLLLGVQREWTGMIEDARVRAATFISTFLNHATAAQVPEAIVRVTGNPNRASIEP